MSKHEGVICWAALSVRRKHRTLIAHQLICLWKRHITDLSFQADWKTEVLQFIKGWKFQINAEQYL